MVELGCSLFFRRGWSIWVILDKFRVVIWVVRRDSVLSVRKVS